MTKKDFFKIILKLYGLYSILELIVQLPTICFTIYYDSLNEVNWLLLLVPAVSILIVYILLFNPELIIRTFKLDQGFENKDFVNESINGASISTMAFVIIAVYMIVSNIGSFLTQLVFSFKASVSTNSLEALLEVYNPNPVNYNEMLSSGLNLLVGFLLLTNHKRLSKWLDRINHKNDDQ